MGDLIFGSISTQGQTFGDIKRQTSKAGVPRPIVFGRVRPIKGNVIAATEPEIVKKKKKKSNGLLAPSTTIRWEEVYRTYAIRICEGPITGVRRVWEGDDLVYHRDGSDPAQIENNQAFLQKAEFFLGGWDQMPSSVMQAAFGIDNVHAYRGTCYMVVDNEELTRTSGAVPQFTFEVERCYTAETAEVENLIVLPLTYDEEDHRSELIWVRQGSGPLVTPEGLEGDGYQARLKAGAIPSWMNGDSIAVQATYSFYQEKLRSSASADTILYLGADAPGIDPNPKLALRVLQEPRDTDRVYSALQGYTGTLETLPLARPEWNFQFRLPVLEVSGEKGRPQALLFMDANTAVVTAHYNDTESRAYKIDLATGVSLGYFSFGAYVHIASLAEDSTGAAWCLDYLSKSALEIDLAASFTAGTVAISKTVSLANFVGPSSLEFITISGTEYALMGEYDTAGTPYLYVYPLSAWTDGATPTLAGRYKRFNIGQRNQGSAIKDGHLYIAKNRDTGTSNLHGWIERYDDVESKITGAADGGTLASDALYPAPSRFPEDLKFHPGTGELWSGSEGWDDVVDHDGWLSWWSSPLGGPVENTVTLYYDGAGTVSVGLNGRPFDVKPWVLTESVGAISIGGPSNQAPGIRNGYFAGHIKNLRFQSDEISSDEYQETVAGSFEPNSLTVYSLTLSNPGAESGDSTGWTNEVGNIVARSPSANVSVFDGGYCFDAGPNAVTTSRQRIDFLAQTGLSGTDVDSKEIWAKIRWKQSGYRGSPYIPEDDPGSMGIRTLDNGDAEVGLYYSGIEAMPHNSGAGGPYFWYSRCHAATLDAGTRKIDAVYHAERNAGTNSDFRVDNIEMILYAR